MANNPYVNKVVKADGTTIIDISDTTAAAADVAAGKYFYTAAGAKTEGTASGGSSLPDGDNIGYGSAPSADLTGTTWYFNETITQFSTATAYYFNFEITSFGMSFDSLFILDQYLAYGNDGSSLNAYDYSTGFWFSPARTIYITGGTDATNSALGAWIQANATEVTV